MKTFKITIILLLLSGIAHAQSIERQVIASGGVSVTAPMQLDYTVGEIAVAPVTLNNIVLTQGFQQPYYVVIPGNNIFPYLVIYPNPTGGNAIARFILPASSTVTVSIYSSVGQLITTEKINYTNGEMQYIIKSGGLLQGLYLIKFAMSDGSTSTAKLLKF